MNVRLRLSRPADPGVHPAGMMRPVPPAGVLGIRPGRARSVSDGAYTEERDVVPGPGQAPVRDDQHLPLLVRPGHHRADPADRAAADLLVPAAGRGLPAA